MARAVVLGAGMVGSVMAADLAASGHDVTIVDIREPNLAAASARAAGRISTRREDLADPAAITRAIHDADIVLGALSSRIGFRALAAVIDAGKNYCDISFMAEDFQELSARAKARGVTVVTDCGVAPGMSHILSAYGASLIDDCRAIEIYVGGLPRERRWPYEYKAAFAPSDVIEEYVRPARLVEHSQVVVRPALSEPELLDFPGIGTLEAFNTDGLRSLTTSLSVPFMKEKTMRYPGHIALMRAMRETGLFSQEPIDVGGVQVRPLDVTSKLLFPKWTYEPGEQDLTVMRVIAQGLHQGAPVRHQWDLLDLYDTASHATSMARTTAFPCTIVAGLIAERRFVSPGVNPPEALVRTPGLVESILESHTRRGVRYSYTRS